MLRGAGADLGRMKRFAEGHAEYTFYIVPKKNNRICFRNAFTGWGRKIYTPIFPNISVICKDIELIFCTDIHEHVDIQATVAPLDVTSL